MPSMFKETRPITPRAVVRSRNRVYSGHLWIAFLAVLVSIMVLSTDDPPSAAGGAFLILFWLGIPTACVMFVVITQTGRTADKRLTLLLIGAIGLIVSWLVGATTGVLELVYVMTTLYFSWGWYRVERPALLAYLEGEGTDDD